MRPWSASSGAAASGRAALAERLDQPLGRELAVAPLASLVLCDRAQHRPRFADHAPLLGLRERRGGLDVEARLDPRVALLRVLPARPARAREALFDLRTREGDRPGHLNRLALHGGHFPGRRRRSPRLRCTDRRRGRGGAALRETGHRLRFVTNNTTHSRRRLAEQIRGFGIELSDEELQTTPIAAAHALKGKRVLALTMPDIVEDLAGSSSSVRAPTPSSSAVRTRPSRPTRSSAT